MAARDLAELICPRCNQHLKQIRTSHGVLFACNNCGGRAVGVELLRRTFTPESINPLWLHAIRSEGQSSCKCPSCQNPMIEVSLSETATIRVDVCKICHFVWFDAHEVDTLVPRPLPSPEKKRQEAARERMKRLSEERKDVDFTIEPADEWWVQIARVLGMHIH